MEKNRTEIKASRLDQPKFLSRITHSIEKNSLLSEQATVVIGLSGGPDSVFLLHILHHLKKNGRVKHIIAAHLDHGWRTASSNDVDFCRSIAQKYGAEFVHDKLQTYASTIKWNGSQEEVGRIARRRFFKKIMQQYHADSIALGHHADDQQETFFIRLMRGASLSGLCGMQPKEGPYIRPLLNTSKQEILNYLHEHTIPFLTDPSNASSAYLRNRIRTLVLPALRASDERFDQNSLQTFARLRETENYLNLHTKELFDRMSFEKNNLLHVKVDQLLSHPEIIQYRLVMHWLCKAEVPFSASEQFLKEILRFLKQPEDKEHAIHLAWKIGKRKKEAWFIQNSV